MIVVVAHQGAGAVAGAVVAELDGTCGAGSDDAQIEVDQPVALGRVGIVAGGATGLIDVRAMLAGEGVAVGIDDGVHLMAFVAEGVHPRRVSHG